VLAREDPARPFHFRAVEVLKGEATGAIDLFVDTGVRRVLNVAPDRFVVLARDGKGWHRLGMADPEYRDVIREILESGAGWKPRQRVAFFAKFLGHRNPEIGQLAHLEVARAPYGEIRKLGNALPREVIYAALDELRLVEWRALHILLLAQSEDARDKKFIVDAFLSAARNGSSIQLGAWATAFIEVEGARAVEVIETQYHRQAHRRVEELRPIVAALSVHGTSGDAQLRDRIVASYEVLLAQHLSMAVPVVDDLVAWKRWEMAEFIDRMSTRHARSWMPDARIRLRRFVTMAAQAKR